jgi:hypothetical protein
VTSSRSGSRVGRASTTPLRCRLRLPRGRAGRVPLRPDPTTKRRLLFLGEREPVSPLISCPLRTSCETTTRLR